MRLVCFFFVVIIHNCRCGLKCCVILFKRWLKHSLLALNALFLLSGEIHCEMTMLCDLKSPSSGKGYLRLCLVKKRGELYTELNGLSSHQSDFAGLTVRWTIGLYGMRRLNVSEETEKSTVVVRV